MALLAIALIIDWWVGDPDWLWRKVKHPVVWFGAIIDLFDKKSDIEDDENALKSRRRALIWRGSALILALLALASGFSAMIYAVKIMVPPLGGILEVLVVVVLLAQKSLADHVRRVATALRDGGIEEGRKAVGMIVGRDVSQLDESGIAKAATESLAENFSDGVVAPAFWYAVGGLPGIIFYKAVNTADSMIGHHAGHYEYFGKPAARLDDVLNWIPARLSFLLVMLATAIWKKVSRVPAVWTVTMKDARHHRSPNAGWPEAAFAASLDVQLGGPRRYGDDAVDGVVLNAAGRDQLTFGDIDRALDLFRGVCFQLLIIVMILWLVAG